MIRVDGSEPLYATPLQLCHSNHFLFAQIASQNNKDKTQNIQT